MKKEESFSCQIKELKNAIINVGIEIIKLIKKHITYRPIYIDWKKRIKKIPICDYTKGAGYYLSKYLANNNNTIEFWKMESGRIMVVKLINHEFFDDPSDMIKFSEWEYIGYEDGEKLFSDMTWEEYLEANLKK